MQIDTDKLLVSAIQDGIRKGISDKLPGYSSNSPLGEVLTECIASHKDQIRDLINDGLKQAFDDESFRKQVIDSMSHKLGTFLISRFGGEIEKQVNALKSDPTTRARITLAIDEIIKGKSQAGS